MPQLTRAMAVARPLVLQELQSLGCCCVPLRVSKAAAGPTSRPMIDVGACFALSMCRDNRFDNSTYMSNFWGTSQCGVYSDLLTRAHVQYMSPD